MALSPISTLGPCVCPRMLRIHHAGVVAAHPAGADRVIHGVRQLLIASSNVASSSLSAPTGLAIVPITSRNAGDSAILVDNRFVLGVAGLQCDAASAVELQHDRPNQDGRGPHTECPRRRTARPRRRIR